MTNYDYDLFVIGAGSGGVRAARMAADCGARVAIAEQRSLGGTCVNAGCVPKKLFVYASQFRADFAAAPGFGWTMDQPGFDWPSLMTAKNREIERLHAVYNKLLQTSGVTVLSGKAKVLDAHTVEVDGKAYRSERILIATGGRPVTPDIPGKELVVTSNDLFSLEKLPDSIAIVGGGYIAVEFAGILHGLGVKTTVCSRDGKILNGFDDDIRDFLAEAMVRQGITILLNTEIKSVEKADAGYALLLADGSTLQAGLVMYAIGRTPNSGGLGLEALDVELDEHHAIKVNEQYQSSAQSVYAIGDVTDRVKLTPVAIAEGVALAQALYGQPAKPVDYDHIPTAIFCQPPVSTVGLTEAQARAEFKEIDIYKTVFKPMKNALSGLDEKTLMKMVVERNTDRVLGMHMVGEDAAEMIQGFAVAMRAGATKAVFDSTIGIHPSAAEEWVTLRASPS